MSQDVFPQTLKTWMHHELDLGKSGRLNVNHHLMSTYAWPLRVYFLGTNSLWLGEPDDVIAGFFESRLSQTDFLDKWQGSGLRLRRWLMNSFSYYLMELRRQRKRNRTAEAVEEPVTFTGDPDAEIDRASAVAFVRQAMETAHQSCVDEDMEAHWRVFLRHNVDGVDFKEIATEFDVDPARAAVMSRTATRKFRAALHDVLVRDGVAPENVDQEIQTLLEEVGS